MTPDETAPPLLVLRCVKGLGAVGVRRLVEKEGSAEGALKTLGASDRELATKRAQEVLVRADKTGLTVMTRADAMYPSSLDALEDRPPVLFARGRLELLDGPSVAVVGTRYPTPYGARVARRIAHALASQGVTVVSGMARGVDALAHEEAVDGDAGTVAVLGTGADVCYPKENAGLYERIAGRGTVISEMLPGTPAHAGAFPRRNRIIAALADVTLVIEAGARSGALITAQHAIGLGRPVAAVQGPVDSSASEGSNLLLRDGAHLVANAADVLGLLDLTPRGLRRRATHAAPGEADAPRALSGDEGDIMAAIDRAPYRPDELMTVTGLEASRVAATIAALEMRGLVTMDAMGMVHRAT